MNVVYLLGMGMDGVGVRVDGARERFVHTYTYTYTYSYIYLYTRDGIVLGVDGLGGGHPLVALAVLPL